MQGPALIIAVEDRPGSLLVVTYLPGLGYHPIGDPLLAEPRGDEPLAEGVGANVKRQLERVPIHARSVSLKGLEDHAFALRRGVAADSHSEGAEGVGLEAQDRVHLGLSRCRWVG